MLRVILEVRSPDESRPIDLELPAEVPAAELGLLIGAALQKSRDMRGQPLYFEIRIQPGSRRLSSTTTLADASAWDGQTLEMHAIVAAWFESDSGTAYPLRSATVTIGRDEARAGTPEEDFWLNLKSEPAARSVSRQHAHLLFEHGQWQITHLSQSNPTLVNGQALAHEIRMALRDGDRVTVGNVSITYHIGFPQPRSEIRSSAPAALATDEQSAP